MEIWIRERERKREQVPPVPGYGNPMGSVLGSFLAREQRAFLGRDREGWGEHLARVRSFLGEGLARADRDRPVLVLGAGSGLEVPWDIAPPATVGWDADPWSRLRTALRHHRWPDWEFADLTGGMPALDALALRCLRQPWPAGKARSRHAAQARCAGLLASLDPWPAALVDGITKRQPATILSANLMGQFGTVAQRMLGRRLGPWWEEAFPPEELGEALDAWVGRALRHHLQVLAASGAELWLVYDRGVLHGGEALTLGDWGDPWPEQIAGRGTAELEDPLAGVDPIAELKRAGRGILRRDRWLWPLAQGQTHLVEAVAAACG